MQECIIDCVCVFDGGGGKAHKFLSSEMCSRQPIAPMIWSFARKGIASHTSGAERPDAIGAYIVFAIGAPTVS